MTTLSKIATAEILGTKAFNNGKLRVPAHDADLIELLRGNEVGNKENLKIIDAWLRNWDLANLRNAS